MDDLDKKRLQVNLPLIVENLRVDDVKDHLYAEGILTDEDMEALALPVLTAQEAVRKLIITILPKRGARAYPVFIATLKKTAIAFVAVKIENTEVSIDRTDNAAENQIWGIERIEELQKQLWLQTELLLQYKREMDTLRDKVELSEKERNQTNEKFSLLQVEMEEKGLTEDRVIQYLNNYMETHVSSRIIKRSTGADEMPLLRLKSISSTSSGEDYDYFDSQDSYEPLVNEDGDSSLKLATDSAVGIAKSKSPPRPPPSSKSAGSPLAGPHHTQSVAKAVGRDIIQYFIHGEEPGVIVPEPQATMRSVVKQMRHSDLFEKSINSLKITETNGYETLLAVADELLSDGEINWGRIVTLYAFSGSVGRLLIKQRFDDEEYSKEMEEVIADFLGYYLSQRVDGWIERNGGWGQFVKQFSQDARENDAADPEQITWKHLIAAVSLGALTTLVAFSRAHQL